MQPERRPARREAGEKKCKLEKFIWEAKKEGVTIVQIGIRSSLKSRSY